MEKKKIVLPRKKFFKAEDKDLNLALSLEEDKVLLREGDRNIIVDVDKQFNKERNASDNYKIYGKIKMVFRNVYSGTTTYEPLLKHLYLKGDGSDIDQSSTGGYMTYDEFAWIRNDVLREKNIMKKGTNLDLFDQDIQLIGTEYTGHTVTTQENSKLKNWNLYLSYAYDSDPNYQMHYTLSGGTTYTFEAKDGIPFRVFDDGDYYKFVSPVNHGISDSEYVIVAGVGVTGTETQRTLKVTSVGDEFYNSKLYTLNILKSDVEDEVSLNELVYGKRCIDKNDETTISEYYVHKHKILTNLDDYNMEKCSFESPIWEEEQKILVKNLVDEPDYLVVRNRMESILYDFNDPFILTGITNNLGYTPTEIFLTVIFRNANGYFEYPPKNGYKFNFHDTWIDNHFDGELSKENIPTTTFTGNTGEVFIGGAPLTSGSTLTGNFVEYNDSELKERIICNNFHKIITRQDIFDYNQDSYELFSGTSETNKFGMYYQPHYLIKLRQLSPYVETSNTKNVYNLPENTKYFEDEKLWKWRDLYDQGFVDADGFGVNHPFTNNNHYVKTDINFYLRYEQYYTNKQDGLDNKNNFRIDC